MSRANLAMFERSDLRSS